MRTSIVTCTHEMRRWLPTAVESALAELESADAEYLILDDGSTDGTWEYLRRLPSRNGLRLFRHERRRGLTECRNRLLAESRGELISILDADDILVRGKTATHVRAFADSPEAGVVWGRAVILSPSAADETTAELRPPLGFVPGWDLTSSYQAVHSATTWRRSALERAGAYDPNWTLVEDADLFLKIGDFASQVFVDSIACVKRLFPDNPFRTEIAARSAELSRSVLAATVSRRYGIALGESHA